MSALRTNSCLRAAAATLLAAACSASVLVSAARAVVLPNGRDLQPAGRLTTLGDFPTGGALSPDGRFYWAVDSGYGADAVRVVRVSDGVVQQVLPLPGGYGAVAFSRDGRRAYVSGEPAGIAAPLGTVAATTGDAVHVFGVDPTSGTATELAPITLPATTGGLAQQAGATLGWPSGLAVTPDGATLVVALAQADRVAIVTLATGAVRLVSVGAYPNGVAVTADGRTALVSSEWPGTVSFVDLASAAVTASVGVGGTANPDGSADPNRNAHPAGIAVDPVRAQAYVAVANRDQVAVLDLAGRRVSRYVSLARGAGYGTEPVALAPTPDGRTLLVADAGEDAVAAIALTARGSVPAFGLLGRIPTASYPADVDVTSDGKSLVWLAAKGFGTGPNPGYWTRLGTMLSAPLGSYVLDMLTGRAGVLAVPTDAGLASLAVRADAQLAPADGEQAPSGTPVEGPGGGASRQIKHVFLVVRENRTYDQVLGTDGRGDGAPALELLDDNGVPGPTGGITPNAHALARTFPLLDHVFADSEVSQDGHLISAGGYAIDFMQRATAPNYSRRGRVIQNKIDNPPRDYLFDQAVRQGVTFRNYGEWAAGSDWDGRPTWQAVRDNRETGYSPQLGCKALPVSSANCWTDSGTIGHAAGQDAPSSRFDVFEQRLDQQLAAGAVPALNYLLLTNDHTQGTKAGYWTPQAMVADDDLALGQIVDKVSHSAIWKSSAIFVMEDDSQDGADHVDSHRMPAFVVSPWARRGAVVSRRYDQVSILRTIELILGLQPLSLFDALATPMYDAFVANGSGPDRTPYTAIRPQQSLTATNATTATAARLSAAMPYTSIDAVPQAINDRILWQSVHGPRSRPPAPGPNASAREHERAAAALRAFEHNADVSDAIGEEDDG